MQNILWYIDFLYEVNYLKLAPLFIAISISFLYYFIFIRNDIKNLKKYKWDTDTQKFKKYLLVLEKKFLDKKPYLFFVYLEIAYRKILFSKYKNKDIINEQNLDKIRKILSSLEFSIFREISINTKQNVNFNWDYNIFNIKSRKRLLDKIRSSI